jgi:1-acyl-sn-glycerol-3-phosphate acyltransferase
MEQYYAFILTFPAILLLWWIYRRLQSHSGANWGKGWMRAMDGLVRLFVMKFHRARLDSITLPESGPALLVANHVSGLDPLLMVAASRRPLRFIIATEQYERFGLKWLFRAARCIPVDRTRRPERALRHARSALKRGEIVALFPHGKIHLDSDPPRKLKRGFAKLSQWANAPVYPCRIDNVKGESHTILALLMRGEPSLRSYSATVCDEENEAACLDYVAECIDGRQG